MGGRLAWLALAWLGWVMVVAPTAPAAGPVRFATDARERRSAGVLVCRMRSEALQERWVRVEAVDAGGRTVMDSGRFRLAAGASYVTSGGRTAARCRFTVEGDARGLRAHGLVFAGGGPPRSLVPRPLR